MAEQRPYVSFREIKEKVSLPEVLHVLGIADRFKEKAEGRLAGICPLPGHVHGPSPNQEQFKIDLKDGKWLWHCFGDCQKGGDVISFVKAFKQLSDSHVRFWFAEHFGSRLTLTKKKSTAETEKPAPSPDKAIETPATSTVAAPAPQPSAATDSPQLKPLRFFLNLQPEAPYFKERGVTAETVRRYGAGLCLKGMLKGYIAVPLFGYPHEPGTNPVGYVGRWAGEDFNEADGRPRYKLPPDFPKAQVVFGLPQAVEGTDGKPLLVVESFFSVFRLSQFGHQATVALLGSSLSDLQADILVSLARPIILMFDGDAAGQAGMRAAAAKLITRAAVRVIKLEEKEQPDRLSDEELNRYLGFLK